MRRKANFIVLGIVVLTGLLLAACTGASQQIDRDDPSVEIASQQQVDEVAPAGNVDVSEGEDTAPASVPPESAPTDPKPTPRPELSATEPSTVNLASGKPVLLEFFAFW